MVTLSDTDRALIALLDVRGPTKSGLYLIGADNGFDAPYRFVPPGHDGDGWLLFTWPDLGAYPGPDVEFPTLAAALQYHMTQLTHLT